MCNVHSLEELSVCVCNVHSLEELSVTLEKFLPVHSDFTQLLLGKNLALHQRIKEHLCVWGGGGEGGEGGRGEGCGRGDG